MLYLYTQDQPERYQQLLREALPEIDIACWPQEVDAKAVHPRADRVWSPPEGFFARFPRLQAVFALGAGVDKLLRHKELSPQVSLIRLTDTGMAQQMREYCLVRPAALPARHGHLPAAAKCRTLGSAPHPSGS
jgi:Phosphoglycerate dehydrogenase and related dehydrogenases